MSRIDLMRSFVVLAEIGSYRAAADRLTVTQPTLSKQIVRLEDLLGHQLFHRSRQGTELTEFGRAYLAEVQPLIHEADRIWARGLRMASGDTGRLAIGFTFSAVEVMSHALLPFRAQFPDVELTFEDISSKAQLPMLRDKQLDIAFARWPQAADLASRLVARDKLALVYPVEWQGIVETDDEAALSRLPFVRLKDSIAPGFEQAVQGFLDWKGIRPVATHRVNESLVQLRLVEEGLGVALMHASSVKGIINEGRIIVREVDTGPHGPNLSWQTGLFWRRDDRNPVLRSFLRVAREAIPTLD